VHVGPRSRCTARSAADNVPVVAAQAKPNVNFGGSEADGTRRLALLTNYKTVEQLAARDLSPQQLATLRQAHADAENAPPGAAALLPIDLEKYATPNSPLWLQLRQRFTFTGSSALMRLMLSSLASAALTAIDRYGTRMGIGPSGPFSYHAGAALPMHRYACV
jgi:hypothetical protein